jgi:uncharacterized protein (TIRG00374 family)
MDGMAFVTMARMGTGTRLGVGRAVEIRLEGSLVANVVPVILGTFSMHAYLLHKEKMKLSESIALTVLRAILPIFLFLFNIPIFFLIKTSLEGGPFFSQFIKVVSIPVIIIIVFLIITLFYPHKIKSVASTLLRWWGRIKIIHLDRIIAAEERLFQEVDQFSKILWTYLREKKHMLGAALLWIFAAYVCDHLMALAMLWGFGYYPPVVNAVAYQFLIRPIIYLAPTPGGAGIWEFSYLGFFSSQHAPDSLTGVLVLIWRLMFTYIPCMVGALCLAREFRRDKALKEMMLKKGELPEEDLEGENGEDSGSPAITGTIGG